MTKYTILSVIPVFASTLALISFIAVILHGASESTILFQLFTCLLNVCSDLICLSLSMTFHQKYYDKLCGRIDLRCATICANYGTKPRIDIVVADESEKSKSSLEIIHGTANSSTHFSAHFVVHSTKMSGSMDPDKTEIETVSQDNDKWSP